MSGLFRGPQDHDRARELAAWRMDGLLEPDEEAWLDEHLAGCQACASVAADYDTDHLLLQGLRDRSPEPPRDLWARTAAALDAERERHGAPAGSIGPFVSRGGSTHAPVAVAATARRGWILAPVAGLAMVAIVVGAGLLNGQPADTVIPGTANATPMTVAANIRVLGQTEDGRLEIRTQNVSEVCPIGAESCSAAPSSENEPLARTVQAPLVTAAVMSPTRDQLVIVQGDDDGQGVYVVPVATTSERPAGSPASTTPGPATPEPAATATPGQTEPGLATTPEPVPTASPEEPGATIAPAATQVPEASPSADPGTGTPPAATAEPTTPPEPTPAATDAPRTPEPTPGVEVTPGPDGAIQIASDVVVVGPAAAYNPSGTRLAFTARPSDGSAGPDVYVWSTSEPRARRVTTDHRSVFSGWHAGDLVVSRVGAGDGTTWLVDPKDATARGPVSDGWLPVISPDQRAAVWWDGDVRFGRDGVTPRTGAGKLVLGPWERDGETQTLAEGPLRGWSAQWDPTGSVLAVWTAGSSRREPGALSLYRASKDGRTVDLENPIREVSAFEGFVLDTDHLAWTATNDKGERVLRVLAWNDEGLGVAEFPAEDGGTIVH